MIYIDLDSTLNDLIFKWIDYLNKQENKSYKIQDIKHYHHIYEMYNNPIQFFKIKPYKNDIVQPLPMSFCFLNILKKFDDVCIITDTSKEMIEEKQQWVDKYFPNTQIVFSNDDKEEFIQENDILIDDNFKHIYNAIKNGAYWLLFRNNFKYNYNDYLYNDYRFIVCQSYQSILTEIERIYNELER